MRRKSIMQHNKSQNIQKNISTIKKIIKNALMINEFDFKFESKIIFKNKKQNFSNNENDRILIFFIHSDEKFSTIKKVKTLFTHLYFKFAYLWWRFPKRQNDNQKKFYFNNFIYYFNNFIDFSKIYDHFNIWRKFSKI